MKAPLYPKHKIVVSAIVNALLAYALVEGCIVLQEEPDSPYWLHPCAPRIAGYTLFWCSEQAARLEGLPPGVRMCECLIKR